MPNSGHITFCDGTKWYVESESYYDVPHVAVPVDAIDTMTDSELLNKIHAARHAAEFVQVVFSAERLASNGVQSVEYELQRYPNLLDRMLAYQGERPEIDAAIAILRGHFERNQFRTEIKAKRYELSSQRDAIFIILGNRHGFQCQHCGATRNLHVDHIVPLILGGTNDIENLQILCQSCNSRKGGR